MDANTVIKLALNVKLRTTTIRQCMEQYEKTQLSENEKSAIAKQREKRSQLLQSRESRKKQGEPIPIVKKSSGFFVSASSINDMPEAQPPEEEAQNNSVETTSILEYEFNERYLY